MELAGIAKSLSVGKAPGSNGVPNLGYKIFGFSDNITLEVYGESIEEVELTTAHSIKIVEAWMRSRKL